MKTLTKFNSAFDINGNSVVKAFYADNTTEIIRGGAVQDFYIRHGVKWNDRQKFYKSISGLRNSK